jgi:hypothetical protein
MTGVLPFLLFSLSSQSFTHMDAHSSQSFTSTSQGRRGKNDTDEYKIIEIIDKRGNKHYLASSMVHSMPTEDIPVYPEPEGDPSY